MHTGLTIITVLFHVVVATHGFTRMIDIFTCVIALTAERRWKVRDDMTKQRAISHLKDISLWGTINADEYNALKMAVKALEQEPNEPVGNSDKLDCISREALLASLNERGIPYHAGINEAIMELPSVQPKAKTGQWIKRHYTKRNGIQFSMDVCNQCGEEFSYDAETGIGTYDFCPNCGAKMSETLTGSESEG